ncbi:MAG TPA: 2,3-diphosphoglycerate-dependent phosphoglycerate mutase [Chitinophagaceae bacterium]
MSLFVFVRHGQSVWNLENRFTGEIDIGLSARGMEEARQAGKKLAGIFFNRAFTSALKRAWETLEIILQETGHQDLPVIKNRALNERNYGELQGLNKDDTVRKYGAQQVAAWRRGYEATPPGGESLRDTAARVIPYFEQEIAPLLKAGENILVVAHGNSLRALMMHLEQISPELIAGIDIPTGAPRIYILDENLTIQEAGYL